MSCSIYPGILPWITERVYNRLVDSKINTMSRAGIGFRQNLEIGLRVHIFTPNFTSICGSVSSFIQEDYFFDLTLPSVKTEGLNSRK